MTTRRRIVPTTLLVLLFALLAGSVGFAFYTKKRVTKEIPRSGERELKATVEAGFGHISISRGGSSTILSSDGEIDKADDIDECIQYTVRDRVGYLSVNTNCENDGGGRRGHRSSSVHMSNLESTDWNMRFTDAVPIAFDVELGLGKGNIDLTGLSVKDLRISTGASSVALRFDEPNKCVIDEMTIEAGLSKLRAEGLANANFNHLKFEGGVGGYTLDFGGTLTREVDVDIEVGLGSVTVIIPENLGAKVYYEKSWIAHLSIDRDFSEEESDTYYTPNYRSSEGKINMNIEAGLGTVKIRREP